MIEYILDQYIITNIFAFFDKNMLLNYDNSNLNHNARKIYLEAIQKTFFHIQICNWTIFKKIKLLSPLCKSIFVDKYNYKSNNLIIYDYKNILTHINISNDYINKLHLESYSCNIIINFIQCKNLKTIVALHIKDINYKILLNIKQTCPKLEKIIIINSPNLQYDIIHNFLENTNINLKIII